MTTSLFSTYRQGENRVTSTFISVLQRLSLPNMDRILQALLEDGDFNLVTFRNQVKVNGPNTIPDAKIGTGHAIFIETKTKSNEVGKFQIKGHLEHVKDDERLLVLTPDESKPSLLSDQPFVNDERLVWSNFTTLAGVVEDILSEEDEPPTEREAFLLREFIRMLQQDGLLFSSENQCLVIAAGHAWQYYEHLSAYLTHPRNFRPSAHIAFYTNRKVQNFVPRIRRTIDGVNLTEEGINRLPKKDRKLATELRKNILKLQEQGHSWDYGVSDGFTAKVLFLSGPKEKETIKLAHPIENNKTGKNGRRVPFTYGTPIYVTLESLKTARKTSELERC